MTNGPVYQLPLPQKKLFLKSLNCIQEAMTNTGTEFLKNSNTFCIGWWGGVSFDTLTSSNDTHADGVFISAETGSI